MRGSSIRCEGCTEGLVGEAIKVSSSYFHVHCFLCSECGCELVNTGFFSRLAKYYCAEDYHSLFGTECALCHRYIEGEGLAVQGKGTSYHISCLSCSRCDARFDEGSRITFERDLVLCEECKFTKACSYGKKGAHVCRSCGEGIVGTSIFAMDAEWHLNCFKCRECGRSLTGEYMCTDNIPYCEEDYQRLFGKSCNICSEFITGKVLQAGGNSYHTACLKCYICTKPFEEGQEIFMQDELFWHTECDDNTKDSPATPRSEDELGATPEKSKPPELHLPPPPNTDPEKDVSDYEELVVTPGGYSDPEMPPAKPARAASVRSEKSDSKSDSHSGSKSFDKLYPSDGRADQLSVDSLTTRKAPPRDEILAPPALPPRSPSPGRPEPPPRTDVKSSESSDKASSVSSEQKELASKADSVSSVSDVQGPGSQRGGSISEEMSDVRVAGEKGRSVSVSSSENRASNAESFSSVPANRGSKAESNVSERRGSRAGSDSVSSVFEKNGSVSSEQEKRASKAESIVEERRLSKTESFFTAAENRNKDESVSSATEKRESKAESLSSSAEKRESKAESVSSTAADKRESKAESVSSTTDERASKAESVSSATEKRTSKAESVSSTAEKRASKAESISSEPPMANGNVKDTTTGDSTVIHSSDSPAKPASIADSLPKIDSSPNNSKQGSVEGSPRPRRDTTGNTSVFSDLSDTVVLNGGTTMTEDGVAVEEQKSVKEILRLAQAKERQALGDAVLGRRGSGRLDTSDDSGSTGDAPMKPPRSRSPAPINRSRDSSLPKDDQRFADSVDTSSPILKGLKSVDSPLLRLLEEVEKKDEQIEYLEYRESYDLTTLQTQKIRLPNQVDRSQLQRYLSDEEFQATFKMSRDKFESLPIWKKTTLKKALNLF